MLPEPLIPVDKLDGVRAPDVCSDLLIRKGTDPGEDPNGSMYATLFVDRIGRFYDRLDHLQLTPEREALFRPGTRPVPICEFDFQCWGPIWQQVRGANLWATIREDGGVKEAVVDIPGVVFSEEYEAIFQEAAALGVSLFFRDRKRSGESSTTRTLRKPPIGFTPPVAPDKEDA